ncbi:hypothetical protein WJX82_006326 [Trebouxia sp. C0006]
MQAHVLNQFPLEVDFHQVPVHQRSLCNEQNAVVAAVVQSKHDLQCLKQITVYKEYDSRQGSGNAASRPASGRQARSDGRLRFSLSVEEAATRQQRPQTGVWCPVSGKPYASLGEIQQLEVKLPSLHRDQAEAARAVKALAAQQRQATTEEQHAAARRHRQERLSSVAPSWPHLQALLIKKQPVCLTRADHLEARFPQSALQLSHERYSRCHSRASGWCSPGLPNRAPSPLDWGEGSLPRAASTSPIEGQYPTLHKTRPRQAAGKSTPALRWQCAWLAGRQQQRHETQAILWQRAQRRDKLHQHPRLPAACSHLLLKDLAITNGHRPAYCIKGAEPSSLVEEAEEMLRVRDEKQSLALPPLELTDAERNEVEAVVSFYEELCQIAQVLKAVDPFCMLFLQQVKQKLETGVSLKPDLLTTSLNEQLGITQLLYTPDQLQALTQPVSNPAKHGQGHAKSRWSQICDTNERVAAGQQKSIDGPTSNTQPECAGVTGTQRSHMQQSALTGSVSRPEQDLV